MAGGPGQISSDHSPPEAGRQVCGEAGAGKSSEDKGAQLPRPTALRYPTFLAFVTFSATKAVISDLEEDKVKVQINGDDMALVDAEAVRGCAIHGRQAVRVSYICLSDNCHYKKFLYACVQ